MIRNFAGWVRCHVLGWHRWQPFYWQPFYGDLGLWVVCLDYCGKQRRIN